MVSIWEGVPNRGFDGVETLHKLTRRKQYHLAHLNTNN